MTATVPAETSTTAEHSRSKSARLHHLDWLRVLATLGVFLFHAVHPFDFVDWQIKNAEQSLVVSAFIGFLGPWGMPLFFLIAGAGSWFSLRKRTGRQYAGERVGRLLIPLIVGSILLSPLQLVLEWRNKVQLGLFEGSLTAFAEAKLPTKIGPRVFSWAGYHLWFLGFLFAFSLIALPLFVWLKRDAGQRLRERLARLAERRGGLFMFVVPLALARFALQPFFPAEHDWADFVYLLLFFVYGYILFSDERFARAVRRNWIPALILGIVSFVYIMSAAVAGVLFAWLESPTSPWFYLSWIAWSLNGWSWSIFVLYIGMRYLDFRNRWLDYGQQAMVPFFLLHQPVIVAIAYFVVQWEAPIVVKLPVVVVGSFAFTVCLYELVIRRVRLLRVLFGMKA
jgi:peptidoglycan/LPS O-acetylase OafA/YrhL